MLPWSGFLNVVFACLAPGFALLLVRVFSAAAGAAVAAVVCDILGSIWRSNRQADGDDRRIHQDQLQGDHHPRHPRLRW